MDTRRYYELWRDNMTGVSAWQVYNDHYVPHFHSAIELVYVEEGEICVNQNGENKLVRKEHLIVNSSYVVHGYETPEFSRVIVAVIPLAAVPSLRAVLTQNCFAHGVADVHDLPECAALLRMMADAQLNNSQSFLDRLAEALLSLLVIRVGLRANQTDEEGDLLKRILVYVQEHAAEPISVTSTAAHFGYSAGRFSHIFNQRVGCSFPHYVNGTRCRMAIQLMEDGRLPVGEVASQCGFASIRTFHRAYKAYTGFAPGASRTVVMLQAPGETAT